MVTFILQLRAVIPAILEKPGVDVEKDLVPVFLVGTAPYVLAANAEPSVQEFCRRHRGCSKASPGVVKYASVGIGTLGHLAMTRAVLQEGRRRDDPRARSRRSAW